MTQEATGVRIRSKNVGNKYSVPKPFSKTNIGFNSVVNYSFAKNSRINNLIRNSNNVTSKSIRDLRYSNSDIEGVKKSITHIRTNDRAYSRLLNSPQSTNRKNSTVFSEKFFGYLRRDFGSTITSNSTYQDRLDKSYEQVGGNSMRRKLR